MEALAHSLVKVVLVATAACITLTTAEDGTTTVPCPHVVEARRAPATEASGGMRVIARADLDCAPAITRE